MQWTSSKCRGPSSSTSPSRFFRRAVAFAPRIRPHLPFIHRRPDDELKQTSNWISRAVRDEDFAIFRFTLGIPGIDDDEIPRVVGFLCTSLVLFNHVDSVHPPEAQTCTELIAFLLALACSTAPSGVSRAPFFGGQTSVLWPKSEGMACPGESTSPAPISVKELSLIHI